MRLNRAIKPAFEFVDLKWSGAPSLLKQIVSIGKKESTISSIVQAPLKLPPIFNDQLYSVFALVKDPAWAFNFVSLEVSILRSSLFMLI